MIGKSIRLWDGGRWHARLRSSSMMTKPARRNPGGRQGAWHAALRGCAELAGFAAQDAQGKFRGFDVDFCRAIAAAVFGDARQDRVDATWAA